MSSDQAPREGYVGVGNAGLYYRERGLGRPIIVLHGGPDFNHAYLLPEIEFLADSFRVICYDQRGRGRSARNVRPEDVTIESDVEDLDALRQYLQLESAAILGHSWGGLLALEYALRHPQHVSHLVLLNTAPASGDDFLLFRQYRAERPAADLEELERLSAAPGYEAGEPDAVAGFYRVHFRSALRRPEHLESIIERLRSSFTREGIITAREIEERLINQTWLSSGYNLLPSLARLSAPALVVHGDHDIIPAACAAHIAEAIPGARFALLKDCGHFAYLECPDQVRQEIAGLFASHAA